MSLTDNGNLTWTAALDLLNREINRLQSSPVHKDQERYSEAVLLHEIASLTAIMVKNVRKILVYLDNMECMDIPSQEHLQRGVLTCYVVECIQVWTVYGAPCMMNYSEFLDLSERLHELLREYSPSIPRFRRSTNPVLLGLVHKIRRTVLG